MEPTKEQIVYTIPTKVLNIEHMFRRLHVSGFGADAIYKTVSHGWWVHFEGSGERLYLGPDEPELKAGDTVLIQIRKAK